MPIPRKIIKRKVEANNWKETFYYLVKTEVKKIERPMSTLGWKQTLSRFFDIDMTLASDLFMRLIEDQILLFIRREHGQNIYINSSAPLNNQLS